MTFESLIINYGYAAVIAGTFLEGETILILGGFFAHRGYLHLYMVIIAAFTGSFCGDQFYFFLGRTKGREMLEKHPGWVKKAENFHDMLNRYNTPVILVFRFLYGLRTIAPFVIGMSKVPSARFFLLNALGAAAWAVVISCSGYLFGHALEIILDDIKKYEVAVFALIIIIAAALFGLKKIRK